MRGRLWACMSACLCVAGPVVAAARLRRHSAPRRLSRLRRSLRGRCSSRLCRPQRPRAHRLFRSGRRRRAAASRRCWSTTTARNAPRRTRRSSSALFRWRSPGRSGTVRGSTLRRRRRIPTSRLSRRRRSRRGLRSGRSSLRRRRCGSRRCRSGCLRRAVASRLCWSTSTVRSGRLPLPPSSSGPRRSCQALRSASALRARTTTSHLAPRPGL